MAARLKYQGREIPFIRTGTFQETSDIEIESGIPLEKMTSSHKGAVAVLLSFRRAGIVMSWADVMQMDSDDIDIIGDDPADPPPAAPAPRAPQDRKPRKAPARRAGGAGGSQAG